MVVALARTGSIWAKPARSRAQTVRRVCEALVATYGYSRLGNPREPLDDLVYIMLSNKTAPDMAQRVYDELRRRFRCWDDVLSARTYVLRSLLRPAGLATVKSNQIRATLRRIKRDFGKCDLRAAKTWTQAGVYRYLVALPGVSDKVAKCVMMYTMGFQVLPVDGHVHRIARRLGWTARKRLDQCQDELAALVPPKRRYAFHVDCILHGRDVCRPARPRCEGCPIRNHCEYLRRRG